MAGSITSVKIEHRTRGVLKTKVSITCDAAGAATATVVGVGFGKLVAVGYKPGTLDTGVDIIVKDVMTGATVFSLTNAGITARYFRPTAVITSNVGAAVTAAAEAPNVNRDIYLAGKVSVEAAQGGNLGAGELHLVVDETDLSLGIGH